MTRSVWCRRLHAPQQPRNRDTEPERSGPGFQYPFLFLSFFFLSLFYLPFFISRSTDKWIMNLRIYIYIYYQINIFEYIIYLYIIEH